MDALFLKSIIQTAVFGWREEINFCTREVCGKKPLQQMLMLWQVSDLLVFGSDFQNFDVNLDEKQSYFLISS